MTKLYRKQIYAYYRNVSTKCFVKLTVAKVPIQDTKKVLPDFP